MCANPEKYWISPGPRKHPPAAFLDRFIIAELIRNGEAKLEATCGKICRVQFVGKLPEPETVLSKEDYEALEMGRAFLRMARRAIE
jgi:hypothetical protein